METTESKHNVLNSDQLPKHIAIIMDGNGRWAKSKNRSRIEGHKKGVNTLREIIKTSLNTNIAYLSVYAFSTENWKRPKTEVSFLMNLLEIMISKESLNLKKQDIKVNIIGNKNNLTQKLIEKINQIETKTKDCKKMTLNLMINYGSRHEIINAIQTIQNDTLLSKQPITEEIINNNLYTKSLPDPEILIRTSGEKRISNFMLWQISYTELYFTDTLWPDFSKNEFLDIIKDYQNRNRRFGGL